MSAVGQIMDRKERPAYVRFERVPMEDKAESLKQGHYVAKDVDFALVTPPYSKDIMKFKVDKWFPELEKQVMAGRMPKDWLEDYKRAYHAWQNGQELPPKGTPIKGWGVISPAQQETLIRMNILTVEDLMGINDEGMKRIGMGGLELKNKAAAWLSQLNDKGPLTQEMASLKTENVNLKTQVETLIKQVEKLQARLEAQPDNVVSIAKEPVGEITVSDILDDHDSLVNQYTEKYGKPPHHKMKDETIREKLK